MSYWKDSPKNTRTLDSFGLATNHAGGATAPREFYELELGVVLDIVLDEKHPIITGGDPIHSKIDPDRWPEDLTGAPPSKDDVDYSWIGRALVRPLNSEKLTDKDQLIWAYPIEANISDYPLINETVILGRFGDKLYYMRKLNYHNWPNNNLDFAIEGQTSGRSNNVLFTKTPLTGRKETKTNYKGDSGFHGYAGQYFFGNNKIRAIKRWEGDLTIESRHGQNIIFKAFDKNRANDTGDPKLPDYKDSGNPMIIIRNRQRKLLKEGEPLKLQHSPNPATVIGTKHEKNVGGYLEENINHDGSSIYITCGQTISEWVTTCYKRMFYDEKGEEVAKFKGESSFKYPKLKGEQIVINTDRLILSSRYDETFHYAKKRYAIVTDNEYTVDAHQQIVLTTHTKTVFNSPAIYLGEYNATNEPVLLGQTTVNWLYELCNWLLKHTHWYKHSHEDAGKESPSQTQLPVQAQELIKLRDKLHTLMSRRVYVVGGGLEAGQDGASIPEGTPPVKIDVKSGAGAPGGFKGQNYRLSAAAANAKYGGAVEGAFGDNGVASDTPPTQAEQQQAQATQTPVTQNEEQKIQELQNMPKDQQQQVAKAAGCGGRRARKEGIYKPKPGESAVTSSAEVKKWDDRIALLKKAGIEEKDTNPPPDVNVEDWKTVVDGWFQ